MPGKRCCGDDTLAGFAFSRGSLLDATTMLRGTRKSGFRANRLRATLIAGAFGIVPLTASTAGTPADGSFPVETSATASELAAEIVPVTETPLTTAPSEPVEAEPVTSPLGTGVASYYGRKFHGRRTASGESFDMGAMTAAHRTLPFGSLVRVTNPANGRSVIVRINDRGPFTRGRVIDVSRAAAEELGLIARGHAAVELELIEG